MIRNEWKIDLDVSDDFSVSVRDSRTMMISGTFDRDDIEYLVTEDRKPEELFVNGELEDWAERNGYVKEATNADEDI